MSDYFTTKMTGTFGLGEVIPNASTDREVILMSDGGDVAFGFSSDSNVAFELPSLAEPFRFVLPSGVSCYLSLSSGNYLCVAVVAASW